MKFSKPERPYIPILFFLFLSGQIAAQSLSQTYTEEIEVTENVTINAAASFNVAWEMNGEIHSRSTDKGYQITADSKNKPITFKFNNYHIRTWKKNKVKQEVKIVVTSDPNYPKDAQNLLDHLKLNLNESTNNYLPIDDNMNIKKLMFVNGWFKKDKNTIVLDDGTAYHIGTLEVSATLYIPKSNDLELIANQMQVLLEDLDGNLLVHMTSGFIKANHVRHLRAVVQYSRLEFTDIELAEVNAKASRFSAKNVAQLIIGSLSLAKDPKLGISPSIFMSIGSDSHSALNKYHLGQVGGLQIAETANDEFTIVSVDKLISLQSTFSNYHIEELNTVLEISARSGDLNIQHIKDGFANIDIYNQISTVTLGLKNTPNFKLYTYKNPYTNYTIANYLKTLNLKNDKENSYELGDKTKAGKIGIRCESCKVILK